MSFFIIGVGTSPDKPFPGPVMWWTGSTGYSDKNGAALFRTERDANIAAATVYRGLSSPIFVEPFDLSL